MEQKAIKYVLFGKEMNVNEVKVGAQVRYGQISYNRFFYQRLHCLKIQIHLKVSG